MSPPPTITYDQRARLLRSTRKLEALLGTTPDIVEPVSPRTERAHRREGRIFAFPPSSASSSSSSSSLDEDAVVLEKPHPLLELSIKVDALKKRDTSKDRSKPTIKSKSRCTTANKFTPTPLPHPFVLSLRSVPISHSDPRLSHLHPSPPLSSVYTPSDPSSHPIPQIELPVLNIPTTPSTPTTPTPTSPVSPLSPPLSSFSHSESSSSELEKVKEHDQRRKKIAKLTRTLGENVPPELVFPVFVPDLDSQNDVDSPSVGGLSRNLSNASRSISSPEIKAIARPKSLHDALSSSSSSDVHVDISPLPAPPYSFPPSTPSTFMKPSTRRFQRGKHSTARPKLTIPAKHKPRAKNMDVVDISRRKRDTEEEDKQGEQLRATKPLYPPSLEVFFYTSDSESSSKRKWKKTHKHAHSSPVLSTTDTGLFSDYDIVSRVSESFSQPRTRMPIPNYNSNSKLPSLSRCKSSAPKPSSSAPGVGGAGEGIPVKTHRAKSRSITLMEELYGSAAFALKGRDRGGRKNEEWQGRKSRSGTPCSLPSRSSTQHTRESGRRRERGWSGGWNRRDMGEVVKALRELKTR